MSGTDSLESLRGRLGFAFDKFLVYGTGGVAFEDFNDSGWVAGGGVEYAFTPNWSVKVEYLYFDLGKDRVTAFNAATPVTSTVRQDQKGSIVRAGLNYKFW